MGVGGAGRAECRGPGQLPWQGCDNDVFIQRELEVRCPCDTGRRDLGGAWNLRRETTEMWDCILPAVRRS